MFAALLTILLFYSSSAKIVKTTQTFAKVSFEQYAHSVFLHFPERLEASKCLFCGGSLILAQVVVTSADCLDEITVKGRKITAYFGSTLPSKAKVKLSILSYKIHPQYNEDKVFYNLGVALLGKPPPLGLYIKKIILPVGSLHKNRNDTYSASQPIHLKVSRTKLPALILLEHALAQNSTKLFNSAVTQRMSEMLRGKEPMRSYKHEAFLAAWVKKRDLRTILSPLSVLSSRELTGCKVRLLPSAECNSILHNLSYPKDTICTRSQFVGDIYESPGSGLIVKEPLTQLIGVYSRLVRGVSVFINVDSHRAWIKEATYQLYKHTCYFGDLSCSPLNDTFEMMNCTVT